MGMFLIDGAMDSTVVVWSCEEETFNKVATLKGHVGSVTAQITITQVFIKIELDNLNILPRNTFYTFIFLLSILKDSAKVDNFLAIVTNSLLAHL